jgi:hypothetical protein
MVRRGPFEFFWCMARATTGGRTPVGGRRRSCRRLLPALLVLAVLLPTSAQAASDVDAWAAARELAVGQSVAIGTAASTLSDGGSIDDLTRLRGMVAATVAKLDALEVRECFRVWWSYVRTSYVLFDQALRSAQMGDVAQLQGALTASRWLVAMANATTVDCQGDQGFSRGRTRGRSREGLPLAAAIGSANTS